MRTRDWLITKVNLARNGGKQNRCLEIGPGEDRVKGFETLNIVWDRNVDYVLDASEHLPFVDNTFDMVYSSHSLEHIPWYQVEETLREWVRILKAGGRLELWVPDGLKICKALVDYELTGDDYIDRDGWYKFNTEKDPCVWASGRLFTYGDGVGTKDHPNWHRAVFTPRYLTHILERAGLIDVQRLDRSAVRGHDHGWINLGMVGVKK
jgi:predicted SAM-dependent methyltransferase